MVGVQEASFKNEAISGLSGYFLVQKNGFKIAEKIKTLNNEARGVCGHILDI